MDDVVVLKADFDINMCCRADMDRIKNCTFDRLKPIMSMHEKYVRENFARKQEIRRNMKLMSLVSFLVPLLMGLKRRMKIPDLNNLLSMVSGEEVYTERELPPLAVPTDFKANFFTQTTPNSPKYFNLHGGVQFEIETCPLNTNCQKLVISK